MTLEEEVAIVEAKAEAEAHGAARGRGAERQDIVAWLREKHDRSTNECTCYDFAAGGIERGEHLE